jgi:AcrR family transcriptional regulator
VATRLRRAEQVERNREEVLAAARRVFLAKGYAGATVDGIAEEAGFSTGVVYSQFGSKADLFLVLLEQRIDERAASNERLTAGRAGAAGVIELLRSVRRDSAAEEGWGRLLIEFRLVAARDPDLNARYTALHQRTIHRLASTLRGLHDRGGLEPHVPFETVAMFLLAVGTGVTLERTADPAALDDDHLMEIMQAALGFDGREESTR